MRFLVIFLVVVIAALQYRLWFADNGIVHVFSLKKDINSLNAKNEDLRKNNESLITEIESLKQGGMAIENLARSDLGMIKKDEVFYQVVK